MQFVLTDTTKCRLWAWYDITGKVNCEWLSIDGFRFAPRTALIVGVSWDHGSYPVVEVERVNCPRTCDLAFIRKVRPSVPPYKSSIDVDRLLKRCRLPKQPRLARILRWLGRAQQS